MRVWLGLVMVAGCSLSPPKPVDWQRTQPSMVEIQRSSSGLDWARSIIHLHSPYSHDACDGQGLVEGELNEDCLTDLRAALCDTRVDTAFLTDHPAHFASATFEEVLMRREGDTAIELDGVVVGNRIHCADGHEVQWFAGVEDEVMPIGFTGEVAETVEERERLLNQTDAEALDAMAAAGAVVLQAHTEGKTLEMLQERVGLGLAGVEFFNLHAMFAPDKRREDLGLDPYQWIEDIKPFTSNEGTAEPDLFFLAVLEQQVPSLQRWDALNEVTQITGFAGTDAHQNVLPILLRDGERGDSYRRMLRWFSNWLLVDPNESDATASKTAVANGKLWVVFESLGAPEGLDFYLKGTGGRVEMGGTGEGERLHIGCPTLFSGSPQGLEDPEISIVLKKNGEAFAAGCGDHSVDGPGFYRVEIDMVPHHLRGFVGSDPDKWMHPYPWAYSNGIVVE
jgi:hypothetical protein